MQWASPKLNGVQFDFHKKIMPINRIENQVCNFEIRTTHGIKHYQTVLEVYWHPNTDFEC